jgi:hypothetical protein
MPDLIYCITDVIELVFEFLRQVIIENLALHVEVLLLLAVFDGLPALHVIKLWHAQVAGRVAKYVEEGLE